MKASPVASTNAAAGEGVWRQLREQDARDVVDGGCGITQVVEQRGNAPQVPNRQRDEDHLHVVCLRAQQLHGLRRHGHGRGADVGALGIAEEHQQDLALEVGQRAATAGGIGHVQAAAQVGAADVVAGFESQRPVGGLAAA